LAVEGDSIPPCISLNAVPVTWVDRGKGAPSTFVGWDIREGKSVVGAPVRLPMMEGCLAGIGGDVTGDIRVGGCVDGAVGTEGAVGRGGLNASPESVSMEGNRASKLSSPWGMEEGAGDCCFGDVVFGAPKDTGNWTAGEGTEEAVDLRGDEPVLFDRDVLKVSPKPEFGRGSVLPNRDAPFWNELVALGREKASPKPDPDF
jgi:hypothetical protein